MCRTQTTMQFYYELNFKILFCDWDVYSMDNDLRWFIEIIRNLIGMVWFGES